LEDIEASIQILEAAFSDPDEVRTASGELDLLTQGNCEFSIYLSELQCLIAILDYDSKAKKGTLKQGLSKELPASLVYQTDEPEDFDNFVEVCMKLDYRIRAHAALSCHPNHSHPTTTMATLSTADTTSHRTSTDSGNYGTAPIDLSSAKKS
jgi:hypothetical protein